MIKQILKRVIVGLIVSFCFWFVDTYVVHALSNTSRVSMKSTGSTEYTIYRNDEIFSGPSQFISVSNFGTSFLRGGFTTKSSGYQYSSFLHWTLPSDVVKGYDKVSFTIGSQWAYFNNASISTGNGWLACQSLSLPPIDQLDGGYTSFVCDIDQTSVPESGDFSLYLNANLILLLDATNMEVPFVTYSVYYQNDVIFYNSQESTIESKIIENTEAINKQTEATKEQTDTIKDNDTSGAQDSANSFFGDFDNNDYGLSDVITSPLNVIRSITNGTCTPLKFPAPFVDQEIELPCMSSIYKTHFGSFLTIYQTITFGLIAYWVCVNIFRMVKNFKNPDNDEVEVLDL